MITTTTYPNGSVITEYQNYLTKPCSCEGSCNCISQVYPKYNQQHYLLNNQQPTVCVEHPIDTCDCNTFNKSFSFNPIQDNTFYRTANTSNENLVANQTVYNILPKVNNEADIYNPFVLNPFAINSYLQTGYPANLYQVPKNKDWALVQGNGIRFEEYETGLKLHNQGVLKLSISAISGSGLVAQNTGTLQEPNYVLGINNKEFAKSNNLVQEVVLNGKSYTPLDGVVYLNSGASGTPINRVTSIDNTIIINPTSVGVINIETAKIAVKGLNTTTTIINQKILEFVDGVNSVPKLTNSNQVSIDVIGVVKTVNNQVPDQSGNVTVSIASQTLFYQSRKVMTASDILAFQSTGVDIISMSITQGSKPAQLNGSDGVMMYINGTFLPLDKYTRANNVINISNTVTINPNDSLTIIIIKSA